MILLGLLLAATVLAQDAPDIVIIPSPVQHTGDISACQGYNLTQATVRDDNTGIDGTLELLGNCSAYGPDYQTLNLAVRYETNDRLRVRITDAEGKAHVVPNDVQEWPEVGKCTVDKNSCSLEFKWEADPFSFSIVRKSDGDVIFDTTGQALIFEEQYLRFASKLAEGSNIQGLAQHNENFTLPITRDNYTRTFWNRDAYGTPTYTNLYGAHPIYVNQKVGENPSANGVFLLNSEGMDIKFPEGKYIEYNAIGGIADLFFFNGPTPAEVAKQATEVFGKPDEIPYWSLGFHSCKYGYEDIFEVAEVIANYSAAGIPMQTQWMDIDYMFARWIMTLDPPRFALEKVQYVIDQLQERQQNFIVMVDPATFSGLPNSSVDNYETYQTGIQDDIFLKYDNGDLYQGVVWPGPTVFPDWTHPNAQDWWNSEFARFFDPQNGVNVSGIWLDMNEPANFLPYLEANIYRISAERVSPPVRSLPRTIPRSLEGFEKFTAGQNISEPFGGGDPIDDSAFGAGNPPAGSDDTTTDYLSPSLDNQWLYPPYSINDRRAAPSTGNADNLGRKNISDFSARTDLVQANGARTYDEHNLYGSRHAIVTRNALQNRRPDQRPFTIARSSFSGAPNGLWLGDNSATWDSYIQTIRQMLQFTAISGIGMVGADSCGFGQNTTETLCARWAWLGAFNTFYRNHNEFGARPQEFYRWNLTTIAAQNAGKTRLRLLDYTYSFLYKQHCDGTPAMWPLSWVHPTEADTVTIEHQFYFGPSLLVSPVVAENSTSVDIYVPKEVYYDFFTLDVVQGEGAVVSLDNVGYDTMPLHIRGGSIVPLRSGDAMTTDQNRQLPFAVVVAPNATEQAEGYLRLDDGISIDVGDWYSEVWMKYENGSLCITGTFNYPETLDEVVFAGQDSERQISINGQAAKQTYDSERKILTAYNLNMPFGEMTVSLA